MIGDFNMLLHVPGDENGAQQPDEVYSERAAEHDRPHILAVDDDSPNRHLVTIIMARRGYLVEAVSNGREAVEAIKRSPFDVVLMDIQMPVMDGVEATREIRKLDGLMARIPIIAVTSNSMPGDRERYLAVGMNDYILKPYTPQKLTQMVNMWLEKEGVPFSEPCARSDTC